MVNDSAFFLFINIKTDDICQEHLKLWVGTHHVPTSGTPGIPGTPQMKLEHILTLCSGCVPARQPQKQNITNVKR